MTKFSIGSRDYEVEFNNDTVIVDGYEFTVYVESGEEYVTVSVDDINYRVTLPTEDERALDMTVEVDHRPFVIHDEPGLSKAKNTPPKNTQAPKKQSKTPKTSEPGAIISDLAGKILQVNFAEGDKVEAGEIVLLLEAMKMENEIKAPASGTIKSLPVEEGLQVAEGDTLAIIE